MEEIEYLSGRKNTFPRKWLAKYPEFATHVAAFRYGMRKPDWMNEKMLMNTQYNIKRFIAEEKRKQQNTRKSICQVLSNGVRRCFRQTPDNHNNRTRSKRKTLRIR
jgi:hypothetical protein